MVVTVEWRISMVQEGEDEVTEIAAGTSVGDYTIWQRTDSSLVF
jgi:hypothetical protein